MISASKVDFYSRIISSWVIVVSYYSQRDRQYSISSSLPWKISASCCVPDFQSLREFGLYDLEVSSLLEVTTCDYWMYILEVVLPPCVNRWDDCPCSCCCCCCCYCGYCWFGYIYWIALVYFNLNSFFLTLNISNPLSTESFYCPFIACRQSIAIKCVRNTIQYLSVDLFIVKRATYN